MAEPSFDLFNVEPGKKRFGYLRILSSLAATIDMPVGVINGYSKGPTLAITAGLYAHEYCGVEAASRLYQLTHPEGLSGRLVIVPVVNLPCLQFRTPWLNLARSISPLDGLNINTEFPGYLGESEAEVLASSQDPATAGDPNRSVTRVIAHRLFHDIILRSDYHVDLRGGDLDESHLAHTIFLRTGGKEIEAQCEEMACVFGLEYVLPGTAQTGHSRKGKLISEAVIHGIPSIISESGLGYRIQPLEENVKLHVQGVHNILKHFHMVPGDPVKPKTQRFLSPTWYRTPAPGTGFFHAIADQGDLVKCKQPLGRITDIDGSELCQIPSPIDGVVHCMFPRRLVCAGDNTYTLLKVDGPTGW